MAVFAEDGQASLRLWGQVSPFLSGEAGGGAGAPDYSDAFDTGLRCDGLDIVPLYVGGKLHLNPKPGPWDLYLRLDLGAARFSSVDVA